MRKKIAPAYVTALCLFIIFIAFYEKSGNLGVKTLIVFAVFIMLAILFLYTWKRKKRKEIWNCKKTEFQKVYDDNIDWLHNRWDRIQMERDSGMLRTVDRWYLDNATDKQISQINRIGLNVSTATLTQGQASDIIGLYKPAEENHVKILKNRNIPLYGMNQTKAREIVASLLNDLVETRKGTSNIIEHMIIKQLTDDFLYFARFFDSRISNSNTSPEYVPKDDRCRVQYEQAAQMGLAWKGTEIPLKEKLKTLNLEQMRSLAGGQKFSSKASAIKILMGIPDIVDRFDSIAPIENWFYLKRVKLDVEYLKKKWIELHCDNCRAPSRDSMLRNRT